LTPSIIYIGSLVVEEWGESTANNFFDNVNSRFTIFTIYDCHYLDFSCNTYNKKENWNGYSTATTRCGVR